MSLVTAAAVSERRPRAVTVFVRGYIYDQPRRQGGHTCGWLVLYRVEISSCTTCALNSHIANCERSLSTYNVTFTMVQLYHTSLNVSQVDLLR
jgi:hypothetical protein